MVRIAARKITIKYNGKVAQATVVDMCVGCPSGALDFTTGLFKHLEPALSKGTIYGDWSYGNVDTASKPKSATPQPSPSPPPKSSSTTTQTSSSASPSSTASSSSSTPQPSASSNPAPRVPDDSQFIDQMNAAILVLGGVVASAANP